MALIAFVLTLQSLEALQIRRELDRFWPCRSGQAVLWLRLVASLAVFTGSPLAVAIALLTTLSLAHRLGGTLNGGSDSMTVVVLSSLLLPHGELYLATQLTLSYLVAGLVKIRRSRWRSGAALGDFELLTGPLQLPAAWAVMLWECTFPLAWLDHRLTALYLAGGVLFHLANCRLLGLNRFLWIWLAAYPALWQVTG